MPNPHAPKDPTLNYASGTTDQAVVDDTNYVRSGNRIVIQIGGRIVGLAQSVQLADDYGVQPANRLGSLESVELIPLEARHTVTVSMMMLSKDTLYNSGGNVIIPHSGMNKDTNTSKSAMAGKELDIIVFAVDSSGNLGDPIRWYHRCVYSSGNVDVTTNRITVSNATFMAVHVSGDFLDGVSEAAFEA